MKVESYLFFNGRTEEALDFYKEALNAKVEAVIRMKDSPEPPQGGIPPGTENKIMHCLFRVGETQIMASDMGQGQTEFKGFSLALATKTEAEAKTLFAGLGDGGQVYQPLIETFFSPAFGIVTDRFGVSWMVLVDVPQKK
ncbi:MAG: VOC family protein [Alphaproteobacteria bacterium]|nr:VOC family protein [Alphaproteobacteria bacterium]